MAILQYFETMRNRHKDLSQWYDTLADLYQRKLWFQLRQALEQFTDSSAVSLNTGHPQLQLYCNISNDLEAKWNPHILTHFHFRNKDAVIDFFEEIVLAKMNIALLDLDQRDEEECKDQLEDVKCILNIIPDISPSVYSIFYYVLSRYHKFRQEYAEFHRSALLFLSYESVESLSESVKRDLAFDLSLSALLGDDIYNFGELLAHPIIKLLLGSEAEWIYDILEAFSAGDIDRCHELYRILSTALNSQPDLVLNEMKLLEKMHILCLMKIIFSWPSEDRTIPLGIIAKQTKISVEDVKSLLEKCFSVHLIEGMIDQVKGTVNVSWVQPGVSGTCHTTQLRA